MPPLGDSELKDKWARWIDQEDRGELLGNVSQKRGQEPSLWRSCPAKITCFLREGHRQGGFLFHTSFDSLTSSRDKA
jgi:hypothetical protein